MQSSCRVSLQSHTTASATAAAPSLSDPVPGGVSPCTMYTRLQQHNNVPTAAGPASHAAKTVGTKLDSKPKAVGQLLEARLFCVDQQTLTKLQASPAQSQHTRGGGCVQQLAGCLNSSRQHGHQCATMMRPLSPCQILAKPKLAQPQCTNMGCGSSLHSLSHCKGAVQSLSWLLWLGAGERACTVEP